MSLGSNQLYVLDLRDDFIMNYDKKLYEFIGYDPVKAYQLGMYVTKWFDNLDRDQQYLHAKSLRHLNQDIDIYNQQIQYWANKFSKSEGEEVDLLEMCDYIYDNLIWFPENEEKDKIKVALFLGMITGKNMGDRNQDVDEVSVQIHTAKIPIEFVEEEGEEEEDNEI